MHNLPREVAALLLHGAAQVSSVHAAIGPAGTERLIGQGLLERHPFKIVTDPSRIDRWTPIAVAQIRYPAAIATGRTAAWCYQADPFGGVICRHLDWVAPSHTRLPGCQRTHDLVGGDVRHIAGLRFASPARALLDLAAVVDDLDIVERVGESLIRSKDTSAAQLRTLLLRVARRGRPGIAGLREFLRRHGDQPPTGSDLEVRYLQLSRRMGFPDPTHRQYPLGDHRIDFAYTGDPLILIEVDGASTHANPDALVADVRRQNVILRRRPVLLRFTAAEIDYATAHLVTELERWVPRYREPRAAAS